MDIISIVLTVLRRWMLVVPILLLTLGVAAVVESRTDAEYSAFGSVLLSQPELDPSRLPLTRTEIEAVRGEVETAAADGDLAVGGSEVTILHTAEQTIEVVAVGSSESEVADASRAITAELSSRFAELQEEKGIVPEERTEVVDIDVQYSEAEEVQQLEVVRTLYLDDPTLGIDNPFGASPQTARVLEVSLESDAGRFALAEDVGHQIEFNISQADRDAAPIVGIETLADSQEQAIADFDHVLAALARELDARQARAMVPESRRVVVDVLAAPQSVEDVSPPIGRVTVAIVGLGGLLAVGLALLVESVLGRRRPPVREPMTLTDPPARERLEEPPPERVLSRDAPRGR